MAHTEKAKYLNYSNNILECHKLQFLIFKHLILFKSPLIKYTHIQIYHASASYSLTYENIFQLALHTQTCSLPPATNNHQESASSTLFS